MDGKYETKNLKKINNVALNIIEIDDYSPKEKLYSKSAPISSHITYSHGINSSQNKLQNDSFDVNSGPSISDLLSNSITLREQVWFDKISSVIKQHQDDVSIKLDKINNTMEKDRNYITLSNQLLSKIDEVESLKLKLDQFEIKINGLQKSYGLLSEIYQENKDKLDNENLLNKTYSNEIENLRSKIIDLEKENQILKDLKKESESHIFKEEIHKNKFNTIETIRNLNAAIRQHKPVPFSPLTSHGGSDNIYL
jgi:chromosome segregation ATPase